MARPANIVRPTHLRMSIPEDIRAKLDLHLYSEVEQRIPIGAYQKFIVSLLKEFFDTHQVGPHDANSPES